MCPEPEDKSDDPLEDKPEQWHELSIIMDQCSQACVEVSNLCAPLKPELEDIQHWMTEAEGAFASALDVLDQLAMAEDEEDEEDEEE